MPSPSLHRTAPPRSSWVQRCKAPVATHTHTPHASNSPAKKAVETEWTIDNDKHPQCQTPGLQPNHVATRSNCCGTSERQITHWFPCVHCCVRGCVIPESKGIRPEYKEIALYTIFMRYTNHTHNKEVLRMDLHVCEHQHTLPHQGQGRSLSLSLYPLAARWEHLRIHRAHHAFSKYDDMFHVFSCHLSATPSKPCQHDHFAKSQSIVQE